MTERKDIVVSGNKEILLHDNGLKSGSLIEQSVRSLNQDQIQALGMKAGEEMIRLEAKQREMNLDYVAGRKDTEDYIDTFDRLDKDGKLTRHHTSTKIKTGAGEMKIESKTGVMCFVATATYCDAFHPDVIFLRGFRDKFLIRYKVGRVFVDWYWINGPKLARFVERNELIRRLSKLSLSFLVTFLRTFRLVK